MFNERELLLFTPPLCLATGLVKFRSTKRPEKWTNIKQNTLKGTLKYSSEIKLQKVYFF